MSIYICYAFKFFNYIHNFLTEQFKKYYLSMSFINFYEIGEILHIKPLSRSSHWLGLCKKYFFIALQNRALYCSGETIVGNPEPNPFFTMCSSFLSHVKVLI